jgi:hypothetical protein
MRVLGGIDEAEMIAVFLRGELDSERWRDGLLELLERHGRDEGVLTRPDLADAGENAFRSRMLEEHRAWERRDGVFGGFPRDVEWSRAELEPEEVLDVLFIHWDWWLTISGGTRRPRVAARLIREGAIAGVTARSTSPGLRRCRKHRLPPSSSSSRRPPHAPLVLLEGHVRLTAYALFPEYLPPRLEVLLGVSEEMPCWCMFHA